MKFSSEYSTFLPSRRAISSKEDIRQDENNWLQVKKRLVAILLKFTEARLWQNLSSKTSFLQWKKQAFKSGRQSQNLCFSFGFVYIKTEFLRTSLTY